MVGIIKLFQESVEIFAARWGITLSITILFVATLICLLIEKLWGAKRHREAFLVSLLALIVAEIIIVLSPVELLDHTKEFYVYDSFAKFFAAFGVFVTIVIVVIAQFYMKDLPEIPVFFACITGTAIGLILLPAATDLIALYISWELLSVPLYGIVLYSYDWRRSAEGALKYFVLGAVSSAFLGLGFGLMIVVSGTSNIYLLGATLESALVNPLNKILLGVAILMLVAGFGVKITVVPFHTWAPDTYTGSAHPVTAYLSGTIKAVRFSAPLKVFMLLTPLLRIDAQAYFAVLAFITMTYANIVALKQRNIYRMMAYSSIAQIGYALIGFVAGTIYGISAAIFYVFIFAIAEVVVFSVIGILWRVLGIETVDELSGFSKENAYIAIVFALSLLSLLGLPPLAGFAGKVYLFFAALDNNLLWLGIALVINSGISAGYYGLLVKKMFLDEPSKKIGKIKLPPQDLIALGILTLILLIVGIYPGIIEPFARMAAQVLFPTLG